MTPDTSGPTLLVPLAHYDPDSSCWRTSQGMFPSDWPTSSETCPRWGMTRGGELFELPTPGLPTAGLASSSSLLPTPVADHSRGLPQPGTDFQSLPNAVISLLPTPVTTDARNASPADLNRHSPGLRSLKLLPTPRASDGEKGGPNQRGSSGDLMLPSAVMLLPTPVAGDALGARNATASRPPDTTHHSGTTLLDVFWLAGGHTDLPSPDGSTSQADPHQLPLSPDATADPD